MDNHSPEQRKKNMQAVKNKDSKIEISLRHALYHRGYRYRKNYRKIYGNPDIVFTKERIAIFCDSEFWHGYDWVTRKKEIKTNPDFWIHKIECNMQRDIEVTNHLSNEGYIVLRFWGNQIEKDLESCCFEIEQAIRNRRVHNTDRSCQ